MCRIAAIWAIISGWFFFLSWRVAVADELAEADRLFAQGGLENLQMEVVFHSQKAVSGNRFFWGCFPEAQSIGIPSS
jgi:hypothetical protein